MENNETEDLNEFLCALDSDNHYVIKPVSLTCGHAACLECVNAYKETNGAEKIRCELCNKEYKIDYDAVSESKFVQKCLSLNFTNLVKDLIVKLESELNDLKKKMDENSEAFHLHIDNAKDEIEIRVESLRIQLDEIRVNMVKKLDDIKDEFIKNQAINKFDYNDELKILKERMKENIEVDEKMFNNLSYHRKKVQQEIICLEAVPLKVDLYLSNDFLMESIVGSIDYNFKNLSEKIDNNKFKIVDLDFNPRGLCCISDNRLLVSDITNHCLKLYDENFKLIKTIDKINNRPMEPYDLATDKREYIYISDRISSSIISLNLNLDFLKTVGSTGYRYDQFNYPLCLDLSENSLYVCDYNNQRIQKLSKDLVFEKSYPLQFKPWMIKVIKNYALIRPHGEPRHLLIYHLEPKLKIVKKIFENNAISKFGSVFMGILHTNRHLNCYNVKGGLINELKLIIPETTNISDGILFFEYNNESIVISCGIAKSLLIIK